jgi:hypothetical protein
MLRLQPSCGAGAIGHDAETLYGCTDPPGARYNELFTKHINTANGLRP